MAPREKDRPFDAQAYDRKRRSALAYDPDKLFFAYARSRAHWSDFLASTNMLSTRMKTVALAKWKPRLRNLIVQCTTDPPHPDLPSYQATLAAQPGDNTNLKIDLAPLELIPAPNPIRDVVPALPTHDDPQQLFTTLRDQQWRIDYLSAHALRESAITKLRQSYSQSGELQISTQELKNIAQTIKDTQHVQRLALNLSTENVATPTPPTDAELTESALAINARKKLHAALEAGNITAAKFVMDTMATNIADTNTPQVINVEFEEGTTA